MPLKKKSFAIKPGRVRGKSEEARKSEKALGNLTSEREERESTSESGVTRANF